MLLQARHYTNQVVKPQVPGTLEDCHGKIESDVGTLIGLAEVLVQKSGEVRTGLDDGWGPSPVMNAIFHGAEYFRYALRL